MKKPLNILRWIFVIILFLSTLSFTIKKESQQSFQLDKIFFNNDSSGNQFLTNDIVFTYLRESDFIKQSNSINIPIHDLENKLRFHPSVESAEVFSDIKGRVCINLQQRIPILRIQKKSPEKSYYIDNSGKKMTLSPYYTAKVLVATGSIEIQDYPQIFKLAKFISKSDFWSAQILEIYVKKDKNILLTPRVGHHNIEIGKIDNLDKKFNKLFLFYKNGLSPVSWDEYSTINLKFKNQIVCTKK